MTQTWSQTRRCLVLHDAASWHPLPTAEGSGSACRPAPERRNDVHLQPWPSRHESPFVALLQVGCLTVACRVLLAFAEGTQGQGVRVSSDAPGRLAADAGGVVGFSLCPLTILSWIAASTAPALRRRRAARRPRTSFREDTSPGSTRPPEPGRYWLVNVPRRIVPDPALHIGDAAVARPPLDGRNVQPVRGETSRGGSVTVCGAATGRGGVTQAPRRRRTHARTPSRVGDDRLARWRSDGGSGLRGSGGRDGRRSGTRVLGSRRRSGGACNIGAGACGWV
jgi:hypothetical protein